MENKIKTDWKIVCTGLICLTAAEIFALVNGVNGTIFSIYVFIVGGVMGIIIPNPFTKR